MIRALPDLMFGFDEYVNMGVVFIIIKHATVAGVVENGSKTNLE